MVERLRVNALQPDPEAIRRAALVLSRGGLVAFSTDTFYALGADPFDETALSRLFQVKGRALDKPLPLLLGDRSQVPLVAGLLPEAARKLALKFWPGPLTIVVPARAGLPRGVVSVGVGLRQPDSRIAIALCRAFGKPVTGTSANISGGPEPRSADEVEGAIGARIDLIIDGGPSQARFGSTVVDLSGAAPKILREGAIGREEIERVIGARL